MVAMWERMGQYFGDKWERQFGDVDGQTIHAWHGALNQFTEDEIAGAMKSMPEWESPFPPTFPEFKALCMSARNAEKKNFTERRIEKEIDKPMLQHLAAHADSEVARTELIKMAAIQRGEEIETKYSSWHKLGLHSIYGSLPEAKREEPGTAGAISTRGESPC